MSRRCGLAADLAERVGTPEDRARLHVDAHGGRLYVKSEPGRGSTFSIALPLAEFGRA